MLSDTTPLGLTTKYDATTNTTEVTWAYVEDASIEFFILEYWDEDDKVYKPFDGRNGFIKKQR